MKTKLVKPTRQQLESRLAEAQAFQVHRLHFASASIAKCSTDHLLGSGVVLQLTFLGGKDVFEPVGISGGLSPETILAIQRDLRRSYEHVIEFAPKAV